MKKFCALALIAALTGCAKSNQNPYPTYTIIYSFTVNTSGNFAISYMDGNGDPVNATFTGTSWSKTITTDQGTNFKAAQFDISDLSLVGTVTGSATINISGKPLDEQNIDFTGGVADLTMTDTLFK